MKNMFLSSKGQKWWPDADSTNAPEGALPRADNLVPDMENHLSLRAGSERLYSGLLGRNHTLYTCLLDGKSFRFVGSDDRLYRNGEDFGETFDGFGDFAVGDDAYQAFFARGTTKKKFDGSNFYNWPIKAPEFPATLSAVPAITTEVASFNSTESPAFVINEGSAAFVAGHDATANGAMRLTPSATTSRASASKKFAADQDYLNILGAPGSGTDLFDIYVWLEEPREVDKITIMFGLGTGDDAYKEDYYYFDFRVKDAGTVDVKDAGSSAAASYAIYADRVQSALSPSEITNVKNPEQVTAVLKRLGRFAGARSRERADAQEASPAWTHLSVTRGQFNRVGGTAGRDWQTVRGFKVVFGAMTGSTKVVQLDSAVWTGGGNRSLTGRFRLGYRFVRDFEDNYTEVSPISVISDPIDLTQQALQVTIPAAALAGKDPQVNQIWVYMIGGFLDTYYRFAVVPAVIRQGMTIDELTNPAGSNFQTKGERTRLSTWGFSRITGGDAVAADLVFTIRMSELEALIENEILEPGAVGPPDHIVAIAGPFNSRMFVLTAEGRLYPSSQDSPSSFSLYHHLDLRRYGNPLWMVLTGGGVFVGMSKDIIRVAGTGDESEDRVTADLYPEPMHVGNPPIDSSVITDGNSVIFRSADGPMMMTGSTLIPLSPAGTSMLWKGHDRHGVEALNTAYGRFRFAIDNHVIYMTAPEGPSYTPPLVEAEAVEWESVGYIMDPDGVIKHPFGWVITENDNKIDFSFGSAPDGFPVLSGMAEVPPRGAIASVEGEEYSGDELAAAITTALAAATPVHSTVTFTYDDVTGQFHYDKDAGISGQTLTLQFATGPNSAQSIGPNIGFPNDVVSSASSDSEDGEVIYGSIFVGSLVSSKALKSGEGWVQAQLLGHWLLAVGLSNHYSNDTIENIDFCMVMQADGTGLIRESGVDVPGVSFTYQAGDVARVEVFFKKVYYKLNGVTLHVSDTAPTFPLVPDVVLVSVGALLDTVYIFGNWTPVQDGAVALWRYTLLKQQWSRTVYPVRFLSMFRELDGALIAGTDDGEVWLLETGNQDDGEDIAINIRTPIEDGGAPLMRKDACDLQIHADTGNRQGLVSFALDGADLPSVSIPFLCSQPQVYRANAQSVGVFLKAQMHITGAFNRFVLHLMNLTYRDRVQQVMVLDCGTIQPQAGHRMVWMVEAEIDCISGYDLEMDLYLDDVLYTTETVVVKPNKRSMYRIPFPRGSKARSPRIVFRTTAPDGVSNPGFEPYRVRVRDRGTGTVSEHGFRPIWPVGEAP